MGLLPMEDAENKDHDRCGLHEKKIKRCGLHDSSVIITHSIDTRDNCCNTTIMRRIMSVNKQ